MTFATILAPAELHASKDTQRQEPSWVHLVPVGTFGGRDGRGPYRLEDAHAVIDASRIHAGLCEIPIDYEHQIDLAKTNGQPAPAAGWITALQVRENGIWGRVTWTSKAQQHLAAREYRYLSPVLNHTHDGRITRILRASLVNYPNLDQLTALARSEDTMQPNAAEPKTTASPFTDFLAKLAELLGLSADTKADDVLAAIAELVTAKHSAAPDPSRFVPIGEFERAVAEVNRLNKGISRKEAEAHVTRQIMNGNMPPALKSWGISLCSANKPAFDAFIDRTKGAFNKLVDRTMHSAGDFPTHLTELSKADREVCMRMGISEDELMRARNFSQNPNN